MVASLASGTSLRIDAVDVWRNARMHERRQVLRGLTVAVEAGEYMALIGANGAGKSSLLFALVGALPFEGSIEIGGQRLAPKSIDEIRSRIGFVFEDPREQLFMPRVREE